MTVRLIGAALCGWIVAWIYKQTRPAEDVSPSFPPTLVLLSVLIAMVTQVIGDSVARAFSLVGALSIVRFRTVVRDTQDTAFVIFAVVVGMAAGASNLTFALIGIAVVGTAAYLVQPHRHPAVWEWVDTVLTVKIGSGQDPEALLGATLKRHLDHCETSAVSTARQGTALEITYKIRMKEGVSEAALVKDLNLLDGVQGVDLRRIELDK